MIVDWDRTRPREEILEAPGVYALVYVTQGGHVYTYVGCTQTSFAARLTDHFRMLLKGCHKCMGLQEIFDDAGRQALDFIILSVVIGKEHLLQEEANYFAFFGTQGPRYHALNNLDDWIWHRAQNIGPSPEDHGWGWLVMSNEFFDAWTKEVIPHFDLDKLFPAAGTISMDKENQAQISVRQFRYASSAPLTPPPP